MSPQESERKLTAILSAGVVGYSRLMDEDEAATVKALETYKGVMFSLVKQHRGRVVDSPPFSCKIRKEVNFQGNASNP